MTASAQHPILALSPAAFEARWEEMSFEEKKKLPPDTLHLCVQRAQGLLDYLKVQTVKARTRVYGEPEEYGDDPPPDQATLDGKGTNGANGYDHPDLTQRQPSSNMVDWSELATQEPPKFVWLWDHWLSFHAHGIWGRGGVGKSLLAQQIETACAIGKPLWGTATGAVPVLAWHCEDDRDEIWRRQDRICRRQNIGFDVLNNLHIDARCGLENALFTLVYGRPQWTPLYNELKQQVNDYHAQVLVLDNIAQVYGGNLNDQHHVTTFVNGILGLVRDKPFCPLLLGHIAKAEGSEFAGAMAWENAIRLRMLFTSKLPDETGADPIESGTEGSDTRFLCKRKANYTREDYVQFRFDNGIFVVQGDAPDEGGMMDGLRAMRAKTVVLGAVQRLAARDIYGAEQKGPNFLPAKIIDMKLADGFSRLELRAAMNELILDGRLVRGVVGNYAKGTPKHGLVVPPKTSQS